MTGRVGQLDGPNFLVLAMRGEHCVVEELAQVRRHDLNVKGVVHSASIDGILIQAVDKLKGNILD